MEKFGFGLMRLPVVDDDQSKIDLAQTQEMVDAFFAAGGTYFDTAYPYHGGKSEVAFRETVVKRYPRDRYTIADKMPVFLLKNAEQMPAIFEEQLERCGLSFFDYYWLHALGGDNYENVQKLHAFEFIAREQAAGRIKHIGFSFHDSPELLDRILTDHPETEYVQLQLNYLDWEDSAIRARECYEVATRHGKPIIVMEPLKGGALANIPEQAEKLLRAHAPELSPAAWGIRYAASPENVMMVLSGVSSLEQIQEDISCMQDFRPLTAAEHQVLEEAAAVIRSAIAIPCTTCRYCISESECPKNIAIPDYFSIYNNLKCFGPVQAMVADVYYNNLALKHGRASDCIDCGKCENHCPQHLPIREYLKEVAATLE